MEIKLTVYRWLNSKKPPKYNRKSNVAGKSILLKFDYSNSKWYSIVCMHHYMLVCKLDNVKEYS